MKGRKLTPNTGKFISILNKSSIHWTSVHLSSALTGAAITVLALVEPFIAAGAAVAFIRCFLLFFKGTHGLVVPPRHWYFFATEKELGPRGYEREEIIICLVTPSIWKITCVAGHFFKRCARVILNKVKELSCYESKIVLRTTKVPQLLKGRFRDDICF